MNEFKELIEYVKKWQSIDGLKPRNDGEFYYEFLKLIKEYPDEREVDFDGEGSYFGKQVTLRPFSYNTKSPRELEFEVSYSKDKISVYSANHQGFWYPEYLCMDRTMPEFYTLHVALNSFLTSAFGITNI